ncbi:hypothetical protein [Saccharothrix syringae]|uniref:Uncharacterized protein n=1 Tax=Saccharothrix syringae TaxID=103733 RepID=A0A5Q0H467_SACSY|nr:hypothetical protein [Saccharothrix syringae]QFZ21057.1 hypothetical protein EKG83_30025 [Saccharothrix syringae]
MPVLHQRGRGDRPDVGHVHHASARIESARVNALAMNSWASRRVHSAPEPATARSAGPAHPPRGNAGSSSEPEVEAP